MPYDHAVSFNFSITTPLDSDELTDVLNQRVLLDTALRRLCALIAEKDPSFGHDRGSYDGDPFEIYDTVYTEDPNEDV